MRALLPALVLLLAPSASAQGQLAPLSTTALEVAIEPGGGGAGERTVTVTYYYTSIVAPLAEGPTKVLVSVAVDPALATANPPSAMLELPVEFSVQPAVMQSSASIVLTLGCSRGEAREVPVEVAAAAQANGPYDPSETRNGITLDCPADGAAPLQARESEDTAMAGEEPVALGLSEEAPRATPAPAAAVLVAVLGGLALLRRRRL